jgi:glutamyl-Q tRNA(Asp) synthetase
MTTPPAALAPEVTRFAPSPTGLLHIGHARAALIATAAAGPNGRFLLRIEDIDQGRCRPEFAAAIFDDLAWLGLAWEEPVRRQSAHLADYEQPLRSLRDLGLVYPCFCTRGEIRREIAAADHAPHGPDGPIYPGICRHLPPIEAAARVASGVPFAWRLNVARSRARASELTWQDRRAGTVTATPEIFGDVVIARKDTPTSYHLACTWDDALQGITLVTRGKELFAATHIHRLLQALLGLPTPRYLHHSLILGPDGRKFSKSETSVTLRALCAAGHSPEDVRRRALAPGL